jgi:hypothetical protein
MTTEQQGEQTAPPQQRFDQKILTRAEQAARQLATHPEVGSVAIVVGWDLPDNVARELPAGVWVTADKRMTLDRNCIMQHQLVRMQQVAGGRLAHAAAQLAKKQQEPAGSPPAQKDTGAPRAE